RDMTDSDATRSERRRGPSDRRQSRVPGGPMDDRRTRFSLGYFILAFILIFGIQFLVGRQGTEQLPYSEIKQRIANGQVQAVRLGQDVIDAAPVDSIRQAVGVRSRVAMRVVPDESRVPPLEDAGIDYTGVTAAWLSRAVGWIIPLLLFASYWFWMLRRVSPA